MRADCANKPVTRFSGKLFRIMSADSSSDSNYMSSTSIISNAKKRELQNRMDDVISLYLEAFLNIDPGFFFFGAGAPLHASLEKSNR